MTLSNPTSTTPVPSQPGEPTWEIAYLFPPQGHWDEPAYLQLDTNRLLEYHRGRVEMLPMPTQTHQLILAYFFRLLYDYVTRWQLGVVLFAPTRVQVASGVYREPDVVFMRAENAARRGEQYWIGADLVVEVVSPDDPARDYEVKRREYARAGIAEYWIVDPDKRQVVVLVLDGAEYSEAGIYRAGQLAQSRLLAEFAVNVAAVFAAGEA